jgi:two-component system CheB/CheR fusion protein
MNGLSNTDIGTRLMLERPLAEELLTALAEPAAGSFAELSPLEAGRQVLRRGMLALRASAGSARVVDSFGTNTEIVEDNGRPHARAATFTVLMRDEEAWLSSANGSGALACVGLDIDGRRAGALAFSFDEPRDFPERERSFLRALGRILSHEVDRASLRARQRDADREREKRARWAAALGDAFRSTMPPASLTNVLDELARVCCETPAEYGAIRLLSEDRMSLTLGGLHHRDPMQEATLRSALSTSVMPAMVGETGHVLEIGTSMLLPKVEMGPVMRAYGGTAFGEFVEKSPVTTAMIVPLRARGAIFGVLSVARTAAEPFQEADLQFVEDVANRASSMLDNAGLLQKLGRSEEQLRVALEAGHLGAWDWDIAGNQITWSTMLEKIHGLAPGSFSGTFAAYQHDMHPEDRDRVLSAITRTMEERSEYHVIYRINRPDGEVRWLEAYGRLLCDAAGNPQRLTGVCTDVTERRKSEAQLRDTLLALREADRRKDDFLAMLAHELRNPLSPMLNATHILGIPGLEANAAARARAILERQVQHMARLLDDLLDVSRITHGRVELARETLDVAALVRDVVSDYEELFRAAALRMDVTLPAEPAFVSGDRTRLAQVVGNLLSNALKFSERGQTVHVNVDRDESGRRAVLTVRDEGAGVEPALLDRMFEPFVQADTSLARPRGGLGLGLAVVKGLVKLHGGRVSASSAGLGKGAELRVVLPLDATHLDVAESHEAVPETAPASVARVLVFEDNVDAAESIRLILSTAGYRVWVEPTGRDAAEVVKRIRPNVVLCDLGLPDRDGYAIASDLRSDSESSHLPIIAITGYGAAEDLVRSRQAGFDLHLTKPVPPALLLAELSARLAPAAPQSR